jgi:hypothetical protein
MSFRDNSDGTVTDDSTGLMWEKKNGVRNDPPHPTDNVHNVNRVYYWSAPNITGTEPDGTAFTLFLSTLNGKDKWGQDVHPPFAGHNDWRLPTRQELLSIVDASKWPRINEIFGPTNGRWSPTPICYYWTVETRTEIPGNHSAWSVNFGSVDSQKGFPEVQSGNKVGELSVRAVRHV